LIKGTEATINGTITGPRVYAGHDKDEGEDHRSKFAHSALLNE
jgi:hypothetical protein